MLDGTVFTVSPDGTQLTSYNLIASRKIQVGYGVVVPEEKVRKNVGPVDDDGWFATDVASGKTRMIASIPPDKRAELVAAIPLGRFGEPAEMCDAVAFLASKEAGYITGVVLPVDGGLSAGQTGAYARPDLRALLDP